MKIDWPRMAFSFIFVFLCGAVVAFPFWADQVDEIIWAHTGPEFWHIAQWFLAVLALLGTSLLVYIRTEDDEAHE